MQIYCEDLSKQGAYYTWEKKVAWYHRGERGSSLCPLCGLCLHQGFTTSTSLCNRYLGSSKHVQVSVSLNTHTPSEISLL